MLQSASQTTSNAKRPVVAATTTATATIAPVVIVQTPVWDNSGMLKRSVRRQNGAYAHSSDYGTCVVWEVYFPSFERRSSISCRSIQSSLVMPLNISYEIGFVIKEILAYFLREFCSVHKVSAKFRQ